MNLKAVLEGLLFMAGDEGISKDRLCNILNISSDELEKLIFEFSVDLSHEDRGLRVEKFSDNYKLTTKKEHAEYYKQLVRAEVSEEMSPAALETLAIIAYNAPITRLMVDEIRGVSSVYVIRKLLLRNLIKEVGRSQLPGKPILYSVTDQFLDYFGLESLNDLPEIKQEEKVETADLFSSKYTEI